MERPGLRHTTTQRNAALNDSLSCEHICLQVHHAVYPTFQHVDKRKHEQANFTLDIFVYRLI